MKAAFVGGPSRIRIDEMPPPEPGPGEILVRMEACGICGSDVEKVFGRYGKASTRLGHEPAGTITGTGAGVDSFAAGDRVFTHHHVPCYGCHLCRSGSETMCPRYSETNLSPCGLAEEYTVPAWNVAHGGVLRLPDHVSFEEAAMIEPLACCVRAWKKVPRQDGGIAIVLGAGPTGMMLAMLAGEFGISKTICLDMNGYRLGLASRLAGAEAMRADDPGRVQGVLERTGGLGADVAMVATGSLSALDDAIGMVRSGGTVMMFGVPSRGDAINLDMSRIYSREITITTSYAASDADTAEALGLIESGRLGVKDLITHRYQIPVAQEAFEHARTGTDAMKIVITGQGAG